MKSLADLENSEQIRLWCARLSCLAWVCLLFVFPVEQAWAKKVALLVGVSDYAPKAESLNGPTNDVKAWEKVLSSHWGFAKSDIVVLLNEKAKRADILRELDNLSVRSSAGDEVFLFFSGHGSSRLDLNNKIPMPHGTGAFVAHGLEFVIGRNDIVPRISKIDKDRNVWMVFDACYSQNLGRSLNAEQPGLRYKAKFLNMRDTRSDESDRKTSTQKETLLREAALSEPFPYLHTVSLAAASEGEVAMDINIGSETFDGLSHGAFTNALIPVLAGHTFADFDGNGYLDANEVLYAALQSMRDATIAQTPIVLPTSLDDKTNMRSRPFLGGTSMKMAERRHSGELNKLKVILDLTDHGAMQKRLNTDASIQLFPKGSAADLIVKQSKKRDYLVYDLKGAEIGVFPDETQLMKKLSQESWSRALKALMQKKRSGIMELELVPNQFGSYFNLGEKLKISLKSPKAVTLMLLVVNANAEVSVLYPYANKDHSLKRENQVYLLPENDSIRAEPPVGVDHLHVIGWVGESPNLAPFFGNELKNLNVTSKKVSELVQFLAGSSQPMVYNTIELVVSDIPKAAQLN